MRRQSVVYRMTYQRFGSRNRKTDPRSRSDRLERSHEAWMLNFGNLIDAFMRWEAQGPPQLDSSSEVHEKVLVLTFKGTYS